MTECIWGIREGNLGAEFFYFAYLVELTEEDKNFGTGRFFFFFAIKIIFSLILKLFFFKFKK